MSTSLRDLRVIVLDAQSTGASPAHGHLLELAWTITTAADGGPPTCTCASVVALPEGASIPPIIAGLTGIATADLEGAPSDASLWQRLLADARAVDPGMPPALAHFARFERSFLAPLHARVHAGASFPFELLCTKEIARRLLPGLPRVGLRALAGYFGHDTDEPRRAGAHVAATVLVWRDLVGALAEVGIDTLPQLRAWLQQPAPRAGKRSYPMPRERRLGLPDGPGVYRMLRAGGTVLYVGKARSLRRRVNTYFQKQQHAADRTLELLSQARDLEVTATASVLEAALLEADEIKRCDPPFNVALKAGGRAVWFASRSLSRQSPTATRTLAIGPLASPWPARHVVALGEGLAAPDDAAAVAALRRALGRWHDRDDPGPDDAMLLEARAALRERLGERLDRRAVMREGRAAAREAAARTRADLEAIEAEASPPEPDVAAPDALESPPQWTAPRVVELLHAHVLALALELRRAAWLSTLSESIVAFVDGGVARVLVLEGGRVIARSDGGDEAVRPSSASWRRTRLARARSFELADFDRLRVLSAELRRVLDEGGEATVASSPTRMLTGERLRRALAWG